MRIENVIRPTKIPYVFWTSNKETEVVFNIDKKTVFVKSNNDELFYKPFARWKFLILKYLIVFAFFPFVLKFQDLGFATEKLLEYAFGLAFAISLLFLQYSARQLAIFGIFLLTVGAGFLTGSYWIVSYSIKYCIFFIIFVLFYIDCGFQIYSAEKDGKVVFHFLTLKKIENLTNEGDSKNGD